MNNKYLIVKKHMDKFDCYGLLAMGCPIDEYDIESIKIANLIGEKSTVAEIGNVIFNVLEKAFDKKFNYENCLAVAQKIKDDLWDYFNNYEPDFSNNCFDSEYCNVKYIENDNVVLLTWKKFACYENYREPTMFGAMLLNEYEGSNFIIDARNGFEDEKEDIEWGFSVLLPYMGKSDCKKCVFIMNEVSDIDDEIDLWTQEFMKYFEVGKVTSYDKALEFIG